MKYKERILVTGGTGYIGSHTAVELIQSGFEVVLMDNLSNSFPEVIDRIENITGKRPAFVKADLRNVQALNDLFQTFRPVAVIHFAALKAVGESVEQPLLYYHNNLVSLLELLNVCQYFGLQHFVFSSSCTVYGQPDKLPVTENHPVQKPHSPYGNTKRISEEILSDLAAKEQFGVISLRYFNPCGAHPSALIGEFPIGKPNNLMPVMTQTAAGLIPRLEVFGTDYPTPDGSCIRDYIHVVDLAKAHVIALKRLLEHKQASPFEVFNIGTGKGISVLEMIHAFEKLTGVNLNYRLSGRRPGDIQQIWADTSKARNVLGWEPQLTLDDMITSAWKWQQNLISKPV